MGADSKIEWTDASWNPIVGCSIVSPGCTNCYAMGQAARILRCANGSPSHYDGTTQPSKAGPVWTGKVALAPDHIMTAPLRWRRPRRIFVNSMGDLFHESVPDEWIDRVFAVMALAPQHTFQVLTKRARRMREYLTRPDVAVRAGLEALEMVLFDHARDPKSMLGAGITIKATDINPGALKTWPLPNVWLGVSTEDQTRADERIPELLSTPAAIRFASAEPLLGQIYFNRVEIIPDSLDRNGKLKRCGIRINSLTGHSVESGLPYQSLWHGEGACPSTPPPKLDWIIVGGESGPGARPMHPEWARSIRDQCAAGRVAFFFKQWGEWAAVSQMTEETINACYRPAPRDRPEAIRRCLVASGVMHDDGLVLSHNAKMAFAQGKRAMSIFRIGKACAGRLLDGREHNDMPEART